MNTVTVHVLPDNDLIDHVEGECPCGPSTRMVTSDDKPIGWIVTHHSLDGREATERDAS